ncbi:sialate O-acetylesterase [Terrimicrobium sacchariphilum]|uniref:Sialate O-acetylesterase n=1 Tax=Terrimicrobium sacchariphilum TaxID=690879 RepID=A0A146GBY7_TERSA|nr:sialate O-acetylesterase [Terrimicrobium sacchariphilum]GAT34682.1 sialate O-acetylesterase [Terrimicrobium sacchariphilum]
MALPRILLYLSISLAGLGAASADVALASPFTDRAVFQQGKPVAVWGKADPGEQVNVRFEAPGIERSASTTAGADGKWSVALQSLPVSSESGRLTVSGKNTIALKDILVGEVWLAAGQSNMDMALFWTPRGKELAAKADSPEIRFFKVRTVASDAPADSLKGAWSLCVAGSAGGFTELGYHFAQKLHEKLNVPIGIINSSYGGTSIEAWMDEASLAADPAGPEVKRRWQEALAEFPARRKKFEEAKAVWEAEKEAAKSSGAEFKKPAPTPPSGGPGSQYVPSGLYNAMIHPLVPYSIRGIIWYQGENNVKRPTEYQTLFPSLITGWRRLFAQGDVPFLWVQLPNYNIGADANWPGLREAQARTLSLPNTGQAVTVDIGDGKEIHPANKEEVASRLARIAFHRVYGDANVADSGPVFDRADFDGKVTLHFRDAPGGPQLKAPGMEIGGFQVAGSDRVFREATAQLEGDTIVVSSPSVGKPEAVRYAWTNNPQGLVLVNATGLPLAPFRTDTW